MTREVARYLVVITHRLKVGMGSFASRLILGTQRLMDWTPRYEPATARGVCRRRKITLQQDPGAVTFLLGIWDGNRG